MNQMKTFWDALIVVSAESAQCEKLWSEKLNDGQLIRGVRIENPLVHFDQWMQLFAYHENHFITILLVVSIRPSLLIKNSPP